MVKKITQTEFIKRLKEKHGSYIITESQYINSHTKIKFHCNRGLEHPDWYALPSNVLRGWGCPKCGVNRRSTASRLSQHEFMVKLNKVQGTKITTEDKYMGYSTKMAFHCEVCNTTWQALPSNILKGSGCPRCKAIKISNLKVKSQEQFLSELEQVHGGTIRAKSKYKNSDTKIQLYCNLCGNTWDAFPSHILQGEGCPNCASSSGEQTVASILEFNNIDYDPQHNFKIKGKTHRLDFVLKDEDNNWCVIQPDGVQHFKKQHPFYRGTKLDREENRYLPALGVRVLRIPWFWFDLDNTFILLQEFLGYDLKKPNKDYVPAYKRIKEMVYDYLTFGNRQEVSLKYKVSKAYISLKFKEYFGMSYMNYTKLHPEYYRKRPSTKPTRTIVQYNIGSDIVTYYPSIMSASRKLKIPHENIIKCLQGKRNSAGGYKWEYV